MRGKSAVDLARDLLIRFGGLRQLLSAPRDAFCAAPGLGSAKFAQLQYDSGLAMDPKGYLYYADHHNHAIRKMGPAITAEDPEAIIQVVIPLLIELNLQYLFDRILVVYIPPEEQIKRLAKRDGISTDDVVASVFASLPEPASPLG